MGSIEHDVRARIAQAWGAWWKMTNIFQSKTVSLLFKKRLFDAACVSILLYGCETWVLNNELKEELDIFARKCYRMMLDIRQSEVHLTNDELYQRVGAVPISKTVQRRQMSFTGHCLRMKTDELANIYALYESEVKAANRPGRLSQTYRQQISNIIYPDSKVEFGATEITRMATESGGEIWKDLHCRAKPKKPPDPDAKRSSRKKLVR